MTNPLNKNVHRGGRRSCRRGSALLEAFFAVFVLMSLSFGCVEFGYFLFVKHSMQGAAREGARAGIVPNATNADVSTAVLNSLTAAGLDDSSYSLTTEVLNSSGQVIGSDVATAASGNGVRVNVQCAWGAVGVSPLGVIPSSKPVKGVTVMRKEGT